MTSQTRPFRSQLALGIAAILLSATSAQAAITPFGTMGMGIQTSPGVYEVPTLVSEARNSFIAGLSSFKTEEFSMTTNTSSIFGGSGSINGGVLDNTPNDDVGAYLGRFDTSGDAARTWYEHGLNGSGAINLTFAAPQKAFGFYLTDYGDFGASIEIDVGDGFTSVGEVVNGLVQAPSKATGSVLFFGVYSTTEFSRVTLRIRQQNVDFDPNCDPDFGTCELPEFDAVGFDGLIIGQRDNGGGGQIPEPSTLLLVGAAMLAARRATRKS